MVAARRRRLLNVPMAVVALVLAVALSATAFFVFPRKTVVGSAVTPGSASDQLVPSLVATGLTQDQALHKLAVQRQNADAAARLMGTLGDRTAGYYVDKYGNTVINVLDAATAKRVTAAGMQAKIVHHNMAELNGIIRALDSLPAAPDSSWGFDPVADQVVVRLSEHIRVGDQPRASLVRSAANGYGNAVRVEQTPDNLTLKALDGDEVETDTRYCTAGFNAVRNGRPVILTSGHCTAGLPKWSGVGPSLDSHFPTTDYGLIQNDSNDHPGAVDTYHKSSQPIVSAGDSFVGEQVCKAGRTTGVTCGVVLTINVTTNYDDGHVVRGLLETNLHAQPGDSGSPLFDQTTGLGLLSGGNATLSDFQPLPAVLTAYGASLAVNAVTGPSAPSGSAAAKPGPTAASPQPTNDAHPGPAKPNPAGDPRPNPTVVNLDPTTPADLDTPTPVDLDGPTTTPANLDGP